MEDRHGVIMYHVDLGQVFVYPKPIKVNQIQSVALPEGFDSVMVTIIDSGIESEHRFSAPG